MLCHDPAPHKVDPSLLAVYLRAAWLPTKTLQLYFNGEVHVPTELAW
jgi:hypothetical protein